MASWRTRTSWALWRYRCRKDARRFSAALSEPEAAQAAHLRSILRRTEGSQWAKAQGIDGTTTVEVFRERVPVQDPGELAQWTDRLIRGETAVLSRDPVERLVPTSGTTGPSKLIPMTRASRREYSIAVNLWMHDCFEQCPSLQRGRAYIATSPAVNLPSVDSAIPVGFAEDAAYLGAWERRVLNQILAVPTHVAQLRDAAWRTATREHLFRSPDLRFLSLWHPGYLEALFDPDEFADLAMRWKNLSLISCWSDGACRGPSERLMAHFPQARHRPKGLWLTEGAVSVPWGARCPVALESGFFEFEAEDGTTWLAHELQRDATYRPILTNHAGLFRYRLGDLVRVDGHLGRTPSLRWLGRADQAVDLCGEKLNDAQLAVALARVGWGKAFRLIPMRDEHPPCYQCVIEEPIETFPIQRFENALRCNPHYNWARQLGQLSTLRIRQTAPLKTGKPLTPTSPHRKGSYLCEKW